MPALAMSIPRWSGQTIRGLLAAGAAVTLWVAVCPGIAGADNKRLNDGVVANVYTLQQMADCGNDIKVNPQLRLAAQRHTLDVLHNRGLTESIGSDGSTPQDRAANSGYRGKVAETVAINPALAISGLELISQWFHNPSYLAIMQDCGNTEIGVWSEHSIDRTVVVAVYGQPVA